MNQTTVKVRDNLIKRSMITIAWSEYMWRPKLWPVRARVKARAAARLRARVRVRLWG